MYIPPSLRGELGSTSTVRERAKGFCGRGEWVFSERHAGEEGSDDEKHPSDTLGGGEFPERSISISAA